MNSQLKIKTISGMFWAFSDLILNQGANFIIQIAVARLLLPEDFGLIGMLTVFISVSTAIIDSGFTNALIREKESDQIDYSTVFYFNLATAVVMYFILFVSAEVISNFFGEPRLFAIIRLLGITLIINSFGLIQRIILIKKVDFKTQTRVNVVSVIVSGIVTIIFAIKGLGVWSLVIQILSKQFVQALLFCIVNRWKPSLVFSMESFKRLFGFGWKLLLSTMINTLYGNLYYLIIGKEFTATQLGHYTNAQKLTDLASQSITTTIQKVSYPVLSSLQENDTQLINAYKKIIKNSVFITFPIMLGLAAIAAPLMLLAFGERWAPSIKYFQILCFGGMLYPLHAINLNILQVKGRTDLFLKLEIIKKVIGLVLIAIALILKLGIIGLLWTVVINSVIAYFINSFYSAKMLSYSTFVQIKDITPIFLASAIMGIIVYILELIIQCGNLLSLLIQIPIGVISFFMLCKLFKIEELNTVIDVMKSFIKR